MVELVTVRRAVIVAFVGLIWAGCGEDDLVTAAHYTGNSGGQGGGATVCVDDESPCTKPIDPANPPSPDNGCRLEAVPNGRSCGPNCSCVRGHEEVCLPGKKCAATNDDGEGTEGRCAVNGGCCATCIDVNGICMRSAPPECGTRGEPCRKCKW